eukprot:11489708-Ditylum_brightwellii.AAC.1
MDEIEGCTTVRGGGKGNISNASIPQGNSGCNKPLKNMFYKSSCRFSAGYLIQNIVPTTIITLSNPKSSLAVISFEIPFGNFIL